MAKLIFENLTEEQLKHIHKAETELSRADVTFDTGSDVRDSKLLNRVWELDWSLKRAEIVDSTQTTD